MQGQFEGVRSAYINAMDNFTGLSQRHLETLGNLGAHIFNAEFRVSGTKAYETSLIQLVRNVFYQFQRFTPRWEETLKDIELEGSLLDYGCGSGFTGAVLGEIHSLDVYGYELEGSPQAKFIGRYGHSLGIQYWKPGDEPHTFDAVLCTNMLEHVPEPVKMLESLYQYAPKVYGNCDVSEQPAHIAPMDQRDECNRILESNGGLLRTE